MEKEDQIEPGHHHHNKHRQKNKDGEKIQTNNEPPVSNVEPVTPVIPVEREKMHRHKERHARPRHHSFDSSELLPILYDVASATEEGEEEENEDGEFDAELIEEQEKKHKHKKHHRKKSHPHRVVVSSGERKHKSPAKVPKTDIKPPRKLSFITKPQADDDLLDPGQDELNRRKANDDNEWARDLTGEKSMTNQTTKSVNLMMMMRPQHDVDGKLIDPKKTRRFKQPRLEQILNVLKRFEEPQNKEELLGVLKKFGLPSQNALLNHNLKGDSRPFDFGNFIKLVFSPVLNSHVPANMSNSYAPILRTSPAVSAIQYKGVKMRPDEFLQTENIKTSKKHKELEQVTMVAESETHFEFLKELAVQQMSSLPLTIMFDVLNEQIKVVEKICESYAKHLGSSNQNTKVAQAHFQLMRKHLQALEFLGLAPLPPLSVIRKFERPPGQENPFITPSSSSADEDDKIEEILSRGGHPRTIEEEEEAREMEEEDEILQEIKEEKEKNLKTSLMIIKNKKKSTHKIRTHKIH